MDVCRSSACHPVKISVVNWAWWISSSTRHDPRSPPPWHAPLWCSLPVTCRLNCSNTGSKWLVSCGQIDLFFFFFARTGQAWVLQIRTCVCVCVCPQAVLALRLGPLSWLYSLALWPSCQIFSGQKCHPQTVGCNQHWKIWRAYPRINGGSTIDQLSPVDPRPTRTSSHPHDGVC